MRKTLFDDSGPDDINPPQEAVSPSITKQPREERPLDRLKELDDKISQVVKKVKALKDENALLEQRIKELEARLAEKNQDIEKLSSEKSNIKHQIDDLLNELETLGIG